MGWGCGRPGEPHFSSSGPARPSRSRGSPGNACDTQCPLPRKHRCLWFAPLMVVSASQGRQSPPRPAALPLAAVSLAGGAGWASLLPSALGRAPAPGPQRLSAGTACVAKEDAEGCSKSPMLQVPSRTASPRAEADLGPRSSNPAECSRDRGLCREEPESILVTFPRRAAHRERTGGDQTHSQRDVSDSDPGCTGCGPLCLDSSGQ